MGNKYIIGIDPGTTTGIAVLKYDYDTVVYPILLQEISDGIDGFIQWWKTNPNITNHLNIIVSEKFIIEPHYNGDSEALKIEGALKALATVRPIFQLRSQKETLSPGRTEKQRYDILRSLGYENVSGHVLDAVTHALVRLRIEAHIPTLEQLNNVLNV